MKRVKATVENINDVVFSIALGGVSAMVAIKKDKFITILGYVLILWWMFIDIMLIKIIMGKIIPYPDLHFLYLLSDTITFGYFFYLTYYENYFSSKFSNVLSKFIQIFFFCYFFVDLVVPLQNQPTNMTFLVCWDVVVNSVISMIGYVEYKKWKS